MMFWCVVRLCLLCGSVICCVVCFCVALMLLVWSLDELLWGFVSLWFISLFWVCSVFARLMVYTSIDG